MFMQTAVAAVGRVDGIDVPPLTRMQKARTRHLGGGIEGQVEFAQLRYVRIVGEAVQILNRTDLGGVFRC